MRAYEVRNWLGKYYLLMTAGLATCLLLLPDTRVLPIGPKAGVEAFQIVIPVFIGQLTVMFRWYGAADSIQSDARVRLPTWVVKWPPLLVLALELLAVALSLTGNVGSGTADTLVTPAKFKAILTACVALLNATTIFIVMKYFEARPSADL
jgi:hypothetical protein